MVFVPASLDFSESGVMISFGRETGVDLIHEIANMRKYGTGKVTPDESLADVCFGAALMTKNIISVDGPLHSNFCLLCFIFTYIVSCV